MTRKQPNSKNSRNVSPSRNLATGIITVVGSMMMTAQSNAALFLVDSAGNAQPTFADNGETTIIADGGTSATPFVTIDGSINMTGDDGQDGVIVISGDSPYTVNIARFGILAANDFQDGINVANGTFATINNNGTITGMDDGIDFRGDTGGLVNNNLDGIISGGHIGITAFDDLTVVNRGSITGNGEDGIDAGNDATITNHGTITSHADDGVDVENSSTVNNYGTIIGEGDDGIDIDDGGTVKNFFGGTITGLDGDGIQAENALDAENTGTITGSSDGIRAGNKATITNKLGGPNNNVRGTITGVNSDGIDAGDELTVNNAGSITGSNDGINTGDEASITNLITGTITGTNGDGIALDSGTVTNSNGGTIRADNGVGVIKNSGGIAEIMNRGLITGLTGIDLSGNSADMVDNWGAITGTDGTAINMGFGDDITNINNGSTIIGDVDGGDGGGGGEGSGEGSYFDTVNFSGDNITNGDVFGYEDANKTGGGFSLVNGSLASDRLDVERGQLTLRDGFMGSTSVEVGGFGFFAELGGTGAFISTDFDINDRGTISPGIRPLSIDYSEAIGTMTLAGDTHFSSNSTFRVDFNPWNESRDRLNVIGDLDLSGGSNLAVGPTSVDAPIQDRSYPVLNQSDDGIGDNTSGNFGNRFFTLENDVINDQINSPYWVTDPGELGTFNSSAVTLSSIISQDDVYLKVSHDYRNIPGLSDGGHVFAEYLNDILIEAPGHSILSDFLGFIDYSDDDLTADVLNSYDPTLHVSAGDTLLHTGHALNRLVENHLDLLRHKGVTSAPAPLPLYDAKGGMAPGGKGGMAPGGKSGYAAPADGHKWTAWATGSFESLNYERGASGSSSLRDLDGDSAAATIGIDYKVNDTFYLGVMAQLGRTDLDQGRYTEVETDSSYFGLYGTYGNPRGYFLDFLLAYGDHDIDTQRYVFPGSSKASYDADGFTGMIGGGYMMGDQGAWRWGPVASIEYQSMDIDSFSESGLLGLSASSRDVDSLRSLLGIKAEYTGGRFDWYGAVRWAHDFSADDDRDVKAGFAGVGRGFTTSAYDRAEDAVILNLGVSSNITESCSVGLGYFGELSIDDNGVDSHGGALEVSFSF